MPSFERDGVRLSYEVHGDGFPVLALAPGGLRSRIEAWEPQPYHPVRALAGTYRVITMDQRNAGASWAPLRAGDGWATYADDHLALLDHLGVARCHVVGMCIGGAFIMSLARRAPERLAAAVLLQPIGLDGNRDVFLELARGWRAEIGAAHPEADDAVWAGFEQAMFGGDFVFSVGADDAARCPVPLLVCEGNDRYHPSSISRRLVELAPHAELVTPWKTEPHLRAAAARIAAFLAEHTPADAAGG